MSTDTDEETTADVADAGTIERAVDDPGELSEHLEAIEYHLRTGDPHQRATAGRAFRVAAQADPEHVAGDVETLVAFLDDKNGSVRLSGALGLAELARIDPDGVAECIPELVSLLESTDAPAIEMAAVEALTRIGQQSPAAITRADPIVAGCLREATPPIRTLIVTVFAGAVVEAPSQFPETVAATEAA